VGWERGCVSIESMLGLLGMIVQSLAVPVRQLNFVGCSCMHAPLGRCICSRAMLPFTLGPPCQYHGSSESADLLPSARPTGKHYDARLDAQQRKLQDMAAEQEEWEQPPSKASED